MARNAETAVQVCLSPSLFTVRMVKFYPHQTFINEYHNITYMDDLDRKIFFREKMKDHFIDYCREYFDIQCIFIGNKECSDCKGLCYSHALGCKFFLDGWTKAVEALAEFK
jgi:hypothetical protein